MKVRIRNIVRDTIRKLEVNDGDVVLVKGVSPVAQQHTFSRFAEILGNTGRERCIVIVVDELDDLGVLDAKQMYEYGWVKIDEEE